MNELLESIEKPYHRGVRLFLSHLRLAREFEESNMRYGLEKRLHEILDLICNNEQSRDEILVRMCDSVDACGDKPIWALNQMTLISRVVAARGNRKALLEIGKGVMKLGIVHKHVKKKINSLGFVDDVCVYLKFEIELKDQLELPVSALEMKFPDYIKVTQQEINQAKQEAIEKSTDELFQKWLKTWDEWQRQLRYEYAQEELQWESLQTADKRLSASLDLTDLAGDPLIDPVYFHSKIWSLNELLKRWVETGMDFLNIVRTGDELKLELKKIQPPSPKQQQRTFIEMDNESEEDDDFLLQ